MTRTTIQPSHVAILVPSVRKAADYLRQFNFEIGKEEEWAGEGTREIYVECNKSNSLLLMEPIKAGAYQRAMEKRGPGIHHLAIDVLNLENYIESLIGSGWFLHPISIKTMKRSQTAYLSRGGFPALIEVQGRELLTQRQTFVKEVSISMNPDLFKLVKYIGFEDIVKLSSEPPKLSLDGQNVELKALFLS